jgi:hypothetical protein
MNAREWHETEIQSGPPDELGSRARDGNREPRYGGPVRFTAEDFACEAETLEHVARVAMVREHLDANDPLIIRFMRYTDMLRQAAETERTR